MREAGPGRTRVHWRKARWSSELHGRRWALLWTPGQSFAHDETPELTHEDLREALVDFVTAHEGCASRAIEEALPARAAKVRALRDDLLAEGAIVNRGTAMPGKKGGSYRLHLPDEQAGVQQTLEEVVPERDDPGTTYSSCHGPGEIR